MLAVLKRTPLMTVQVAAELDVSAECEAQCDHVEGKASLSPAKLIGPGATMLAGAGAFICSVAFISDDRLNLMLIHPLVMFGLWLAQYGGGLIFLIGVIWLWNQMRQPRHWPGDLPR